MEERLGKINPYRTLAVDLRVSGPGPELWEETLLHVGDHSDSGTIHNHIGQDPNP